MRRRIVIITLLLILGAIMNIAVAWYGAYSFEGWSDTDREIPMDTFSGWRAELPSHWPTLDVGAGKGQLWTVFAGSVFHNDLDIEANVLHKTEYFGIFQWRTGWPMRSLQCENWAEFIMEGRPRVTTYRFDGHPPASFWHEGISIDRGLSVLPVLPVLPGFVINTLFFAILIWLIWITPFAVRRMIRRRRGLCEKCAYPVGSNSVCTECGAAVSRPRSVEA